jgi:hypothetical protein
MTRRTVLIYAFDLNLLLRQSRVSFVQIWLIKQYHASFPQTYGLIPGYGFLKIKQMTPDDLHVYWNLVITQNCHKMSERQHSYKDILRKFYKA